MKRALVMLCLAVATGLVGAAADGDKKGSAAVARPKPPHRLSWAVQIGIEPPPSKALVVLLPEPDGRPSALVVTTARGEAVLDRPYAKADVGGKGAIEVGEISPEEVRRRFGATLAAQPPRPLSWLLYFSNGRSTLAATSKAALDQATAELKAELARRATAEIVVVGHTDRVGKTAANDALSLRRARVVAKALIAAGIDPRQTEFAGRGAREPLVPAAAGRAEPKNRRVEIVIR